jgi:hypothetical protein
MTLIAPTPSPPLVHIHIAAGDDCALSIHVHNRRVCNGHLQDTLMNKLVEHTMPSVPANAPPPSTGAYDECSDGISDRSHSVVSYGHLN